MNHLRRGLMVALSATMLTACGGGGTPTASFTGDPIPAAILLSERQAKKLVPKVTAIPTPTVTASGSAVATSVPLPVRSVGPSANPVAASLAEPPTVGFYPYKITVSAATFGNQTGTFDVRMHEPIGVRGGKRQLQTWEIEEAPQEFLYEWTSSKLLLVHVKQTLPDGSTYECDMDPPRLEMTLPLTVGRTWSSESTCDEVDVSYSARVIRTEKVSVGGSSVDTFVIEGIQTSKADGEESETKTITWFAPEHRLVVRQDSESKFGGPSSAAGTFKVYLDLQSLAPRAE